MDTMGREFEGRMLVLIYVGFDVVTTGKEAVSIWKLCMNYE
jgi:hypothetical protein